MKAYSIRLAMLALGMVAALATAAERLVFMPEVIDFGELPVNGSCTREFAVSNATSEMVLVEWMESDAGASAQFFRDRIMPRERIDGCVCMTAGSKPGVFTNELVFSLGGVTNTAERFRLAYRAVEGDPGVAYPDAGFGKLDEPSPMDKGRRVVWKCSRRLQVFMDALHKTNLIERALALNDLAYGYNSNRDPSGKIATAELNSALRKLFIDGVGTDGDRDRAFNKYMISVFMGIDPEIDAAISGYKDAKMRVAMEKQNAEMERRFKEQREKWEAEERKRVEENNRLAAIEKERYEKKKEQQKEWSREMAWHAAGLPGNRQAKVWEEYLAGEGGAFADSVYFKTNVFLPFLVREFAVDKEEDAELRGKILGILERDIVDPLLHIGVSAENLEDRKGRGLESDSFEPVAKWAHEYFLQTESRNPFILSVLVFHDLRVVYRLSDSNGGTRRGRGYELSEGYLPEGRDGLAMHLVRNLCTEPGNRYVPIPMGDFRTDRCTPLLAWCKALEEEGARPEHWRCVMLLALRVTGTYLNWDGREAYPEMADALEKAGCAPMLIRMFREEPAITGHL